MGLVNEGRERVSEGAEPVEVAERDIATWLRERVGSRAASDAIAVHDGERWVRVGASEFVTEVERLRAGLTGAGVTERDRVVVMGPTSAEWSRLDLAIMCAGAITVPVYPGSSEEQCRSMLRTARPSIAFVASSDDVETLHRVDPDLDVRRLDRETLDGLSGDPRGIDPVPEAVADPTSIATIVFTSGTTGAPKGVPLTHEQLVWTARQAGRQLETVLGSGGSTLLFLPLAHIFARVVVLAALDSGVELAYGRSIETVPEDLRSYRPTFLLVVPRMLERVISGGRKQAEGWRRPVYDWGIRAARRWSKSERRGPLLRLQHGLANLLVLRQLRAGLGGRVEVTVSGGARLDPDLAHVIEGAGITVLEGYGLTETTGPATVAPPQQARIGTVGTPIPGMEIRISSDDEVLVRGPSVTTGYVTEESPDIDDPIRPEESFDGDGWFRTGDHGSLSADGHLTITGRAKDVIVTDGGQNVAPVPLEDALVAHPAIDQAMVIGDGRPFVAALVALTEDAPGDDGELDEAVRRAVDDANAAVGGEVGISEFRIVGRAFDEEHGELTPTMKLRREEILEHFTDDVAAIYDEVEQ